MCCCCCGCCFDFEEPEGELGTRLSWDPLDVDKAVGERGCCNGKFTMYMALQFLLCIFYAISYGSSFTATNAYYEWPMNKIENSSLREPYPNETEVWLTSILEETPYFECGGRTFHRNGTGPILRYSGDIVISYKGGDASVYVCFCYLMIFFFAGFVVVGLYQGHYNRLLLIVSFGKDEDGKIQPKKLSFVWTIMCNAKTMYNVVFGEMCGRVIEFLVDENRAKNNGVYEEYTLEGEELMAFVYVFGVCIVLFWIFLYLLPLRVSWFYPEEKESEASFRWCVFRLSVVMNVIILYVIWLTHFDPPSEFNPETPWLYFTNVVAWTDLGVNTLYDAYVAGKKLCPCGTPGSAAYTEKGTESAAADTEIGAETAPDTEEDLPPPEMAPNHQRVPVERLPSNKHNGHHSAAVKKFLGGHEKVFQAKNLEGSMSRDCEIGSANPAYKAARTDSKKKAVITETCVEPEYVLGPAPGFGTEAEPDEAETYPRPPPFLGTEADNTAIFFGPPPVLETEPDKVPPRCNDSKNSVRTEPKQHRYKDSENLVKKTKPKQRHKHKKGTSSLVSSVKSFISGDSYSTTDTSERTTEGCTEEEEGFPVVECSLVLETVGEEEELRTMQDGASQGLDKNGGSIEKVPTLDFKKNESKSSSKNASKAQKSSQKDDTSPSVENKKHHHKNNPSRHHRHSHHRHNHTKVNVFASTGREEVATKITEVHPEGQDDWGCAVGSSFVAARVDPDGWAVSSNPVGTGGNDETDPKYPLNAYVELVGLKTASENGKYGVIVGQKTGRIVVRLLDENRTLKVKKQNVSVSSNPVGTGANDETDPRYPLGAYVELVGLKTASENGKYAVIVGQETGRIVVRLLDENRTLKVKKHNVSVIEEDGARF